MLPPAQHIAPVAELPLVVALLEAMVLLPVMVVALPEVVAVVMVEALPEQVAVASLEVQPPEVAVAPLMLALQVVEEAAPVPPSPSLAPPSASPNTPASLASPSR